MCLALRAAFGCSNRLPADSSNPHGEFLNPPSAFNKKAVLLDGFLLKLAGKGGFEPPIRY